MTALEKCVGTHLSLQFTNIVQLNGRQEINYEQMNIREFQLHE